jgi:trans-2,3-dihydro-3-hydroxyanthranilate isomerase
MVPISSLDALARARVNVPAWSSTLEKTWAPEMFLFTRTGDNEFRARMYAPTMGIIEDPATGSACACFGAYQSSLSDSGDGTRRYRVHQGVEMGRPSVLQVSADVVDGRVSAVRVGGSTVLISSGELLAI